MKTFKPFDLEAAKAGEPLVTRDGRKARLLAHVPEFEEEHRVIFAIEGEGHAMSYSESGVYVHDEASDFDLFMAPKTRTVFVNLYRFKKDGIWDFYGSQFDTAEAAGKGADIERALAIAVPVEITE